MLDGPGISILKIKIWTANRKPIARQPTTDCDIKSLLVRQDLSDYVIRVGPKKFSCHKIILSVRSNFFEAVF